MTNTDTATAETGKPKKVAVAIRDWINAAGQPLESGKESEVTGIRYIHLPTAKRANPAYNPETDTAPAGSVFELDMTKLPPAALLMLGAFGAQTLAGNVVNTAVNGPKGDPNVNPVPLIEARFAELANGEWADRAGGVGGVRYEKDKLAAAIAQAKGESDPAPYLAKMETKVDPKSGAVVANDAKGAISYGAYALRNAKVKAAYDALTGGGTTIESL
jgi:hypothetical protein